MARLTPGPARPVGSGARGLSRKRGLARAALWVEQLWPAIWPALGVLCGFIVLALLDVPAMLPPWPRLALPVCALLLALLLLWRGLRRVVPPAPEAVDRRLERDSGLRHRPLAALQDRPASPSAEGAALWALHQDRLRAQLGRLRVGAPRPGLARLDPRALRYLAALGVVVALVIAGSSAPSRLASAVWPGLPGGLSGPGTVVQAWITPPSYTGLPPIFLQTATPPPGPIVVPAGSRLTMSVTGGWGAPSLTLDGESTAFKALDGSSWQADRTIAAGPEGGSRLAVRRSGGEIAGWALLVRADQPPMIRFAEPPGPMRRNGPRGIARTRLAWMADDDYGLTQVQAELRLQDRPDAPPLTLNAGIAGAPKQAHGAVVQDLTAHPWAGLPVLARMVARDAPGQVGQSMDVPFTLPERVFVNPLAQAVIAVRKQLSVAPEERREAHDALAALAGRPDLFEDSSRVELALGGAAALLLHGRGQPAVDEAQARLWALAIALEEGAADRTAAALAQARREARDAMETARQDPTDPAAMTALDEKMQALRDAIQKHIEALAEQARRDGTEMLLDPNQPQMNARDLDRMAERAEQAAREGRMDEAQQQMAQLEKLLEQLQNARPEHGEQREQRQAQRRQQGQEQMDAVQDIVRREGGLLDSSRARADHPLPPPSPLPGPPAGQAGSPPGAAPEQQAAGPRGHDQRAQQAMRRALGELMQRYGDLTGQVPAPLGEADTAMRDANQAMAEGRDLAASAAQQKAIEALQKGGRSMRQQLSRQFGAGDQDGEGDDGQEMGEGEQDGQGNGQAGNQPGDRPGESGQRPGDGRRHASRRDPLGRPLPEDMEGGQGNDGDALGSQDVPTEQEQARARALQDELRRRGADRTRPQPELDYIDRLLKSF